jgi:hypothetical protein
VGTLPYIQWFTHSLGAVCGGLYLPVVYTLTAGCLYWAVPSNGILHCQHAAGGGLDLPGAYCTTNKMLVRGGAVLYSLIVF